MGERKTSDEEDGSGICWVTDIGVEAVSDEFVFRVHGEVEGKELAEGVETVEANIGAEDYCDHADGEEGREAYIWL